MNDDPGAPTPSSTGSIPLPDHPVELDVLRLTRRGDGIALWGERPVFLPNTDTGERALVVVTDVRNRLQGQVLEILQASSHRRDPECPHAIRCPGCQVRHLSSARQMDHTLSRIQDWVHEAVGMETEWQVIAEAERNGGRSRVVARALRNEAGLLTLGMSAGDGSVVSLGQCPVQSEGTRNLIAKTQRDLRTAQLKAYDPLTRTGTVRHVFAEVSALGARVVIALAHPVPDLQNDILLADMPDTHIAIDVLPKRGAGTFSAPQAVRGSLAMTLDIDGDRLRATLPAWTPQAPQTIPLLRQTVVEWLAPKPTDHVIEVGCGIGTLSLPLARKSLRLTGIDRCRAAIEDATHNGGSNGVRNASFLVGDARHALRRALARGETADLVVLHAMRRPFGPEVMSAVRALGPRRLLYLAPNPASLADDLRALLGRCRGDDSGTAAFGYTLTRGGVVDQAPGTTDLLTVVALERTSNRAR